MTARTPAQNIIAMLWDFDNTLIEGHMYTPLFEHYRADQQAFWQEVEARRSAEYHSSDYEVGDELVYLNHILDYVRDGRFEGLNNALLRRLGGQLAARFFPGMPDFLGALKQHVADDPKCRRCDIKLEHYVVSAGLRQVILGSAAAPHLDGVWGCELLEEDGVVAKIAYVIDHTTKTRAVFEINKGVNKRRGIRVNTYVPHNERRIPIEQIIYVADGPSDVPVFSLINRLGGWTYGVYVKDRPDAYDQMHSLMHKQKRVHAFSAADYRGHSEAALWLRRTVDHIVDDIAERIDGRRSAPPGHLRD